jgi:phage terminase large subunit-like protein
VARKKPALDPVTRYAVDVRDGRIVASRLVRLACERHLSDLERQREKGLVWKPEEAQAVIDFFAEVLCLPEDAEADERVDVDDDGEPQPFILQPFQQFIAGSLFGWYTSKGSRRFKQAYIETAKGSGKTPFGAGLMLYVLVADGPRASQVYAAATGRDQAKLAFTDAERMVEASPHLAALIDAKVNNLAILETGSFFRPVSSEGRGLDGKRVQAALIDELHEHPTPVVVNKMRKGTKGRPNALILEITNSGFDRTSVCWHHHEYSRSVLQGSVPGEDWFAFVCGLDPCQACADAGKWFPSEDCPDCDDWKTEGPHWLKANPNLGVSIPWQYVRDLVTQAQGMPSEVSDVLRFNFCVWTQGVSRAIDLGRWAACKPLPSDDELIGVPCYGGLDLGESDDLSAWARIWPLDDGRVAVKMRYWLPSAALERYPNRPYPEWRRRGLLTVTDGDITDYSVVREQILKDCKHDGVQAIAFDPRSAIETSQILGGLGIQMINTTQGFALHEAIRRTLELIVAGDLCHGKDPILTWMAGNVVLFTGTKGEKRLDKEHAPEKIDGIAALVDAVDWGIVRKERRSYQFQVRNLAEFVTG